MARELRLIIPVPSLYHIFRTNDAAHIFITLLLAFVLLRPQSLQGVDVRRKEVIAAEPFVRIVVECRLGRRHAVDGTLRQ